MLLVLLLLFSPPSSPWTANSNAVRWNGRSFVRSESRCEPTVDVDVVDVVPPDVV